MEEKQTVIPKRCWKKYGKTGKLLPLMPLINPIQHTMLGFGYQTAYLKAHYPAEYMAAVLSNNMNDIKQVTFFMEECRRMGLKVLGPDINESFYKFTVNDEQAIRFGDGAVKGVGRGAVETIIEHRKEGKYRSIFDLTQRIDLRAANKKAIENLTLAGGMDSF